MFTIIQLPSPICLNQDVNYTIIVINNESNLTQHYGPYRHVGPGTVKHDIVSGLERNQEYSVYIEVEISRNVTVISNETRFGKLSVILLCMLSIELCLIIIPIIMGKGSFLGFHQCVLLQHKFFHWIIKLLFMQTRTFKMKRRCSPAPLSAQKV